MKKKLISILAAAAMLFSLAAPALAYDGDPGFGLPWYGDEVTLGDFTAIEQFREYRGNGWTSRYTNYVITGLAASAQSATEIVIPRNAPNYNDTPNNGLFIGIADEAFKNNTSLQKVTFNFDTVMGENISFIGSYDIMISKYDGAFEGCSNLKEVVFNTSLCPSIKDNAFDGIAANATATVPASALGYGDNMFNPNYYPFVNNSPLRLTTDANPDAPDALKSVTASQKPGSVLMPGVEYSAETVASMFNISGTLNNGSVADLTNAMYYFSDNLENSTLVAQTVNGKVTFANSGTVKIAVVLNGITKYAATNVVVTPRRAGEKSSLQNSPQNSDILKGQFQMTLSAAQQAQLGDTYDVSFYYRVDPSTLMHNFMVYNTDGTMMADKGNGFYILQGKVINLNADFGTPNIELTQDSDIWSIYYGGELVATCNSTDRWTGWHKVTIKYRNGGIGVFVDDVQRTLTTVKEGAVSADNYVNTAANYKISKIGPIGTQGWRQPQFSTDADLSGAVNYKTEMGRANFDTYTVTSGGTQVFSYACDSIPSFFSSIWQVKDLNNGAVVYNTPAFDYVWYQN